MRIGLGRFARVRSKALPPWPISLYAAGCDAAGVAKLVDATDLNPSSSARREIGDAELLKFGEASFLVIPSQAAGTDRSGGRCRD